MLNRRSTSTAVKGSLIPFTCSWKFSIYVKTKSGKEMQQMNTFVNNPLFLNKFHIVAKRENDTNSAKIKIGIFCHKRDINHYFLNLGSFSSFCCRILPSLNLLGEIVCKQNEFTEVHLACLLVVVGKSGTEVWCSGSLQLFHSSACNSWLTLG